MGYTLTNFFTLDYAVPGTGQKQKKSAISTPKDHKTEDDLDNCLNLSIGIK